MAENTPLNLRSKVIYQIFTRNYPGGGTFRAVQNDLDRIQALGVDILYLLPIQPSGEVHRKGSMGSPYAIRDYRAIDPVQGTMADFEALCAAVHEHGMKVMLDVVYNHTSPDSVLAKTHPDWFYHKADGSHGNRIGDWWDVVDLDYSNPGLWDYQIETLKMWAKYVDGFRCDVAPMVPLVFWRRARREVAEVRPDCIWLAESVEPVFLELLHKASIPASSDGELYQAFDVTYDYDIFDDMKRAMLGEEDLSEYLAALNRQEWIYPANYAKLRCLENHDRPRAAALLPDETALRSWTAFQFFCKGVAMLYAGQEFCVTHHPTLFDRDTVDFATGKDISAFLASLSKLKKHPIFSEGLFHATVVGSRRDIIAATWEMPAHSENPNLCALGFFPLSRDALAVGADLPDGICRNEITGEEVDIYERVLSLHGEPVIILTDKKAEAHT